MASNDYLPRQDTVLVAWLTQFRTELTSLATTLGLVAADTTAVGNDITSVQTAVQDQVAKKAAQQASTAAKKTALKTVLPRFRALVKRIKAHPAYTPAMGERLGIVGPQSVSLMADLSGGSKPRLRTGDVRNGSVEIRFAKNGFTGVLITCRRGTSDELESLGKQIHSPLIDLRRNLAKGPETRCYQAWYLDGDEIAGEASDILVVTVPE